MCWAELVLSYCGHGYNKNLPSTAIKDNMNLTAWHFKQLLSFCPEYKDHSFNLFQDPGLIKKVYYRLNFKKLWTHLLWELWLWDPSGLDSQSSDPLQSPLSPRFSPFFLAGEAAAPPEPCNVGWKLLPFLLWLSTVGNKEDDDKEEEERDESFLFFDPPAGSSMSLDARLPLCVPLRDFASAKTWAWCCGESLMLNTPGVDADWGNMAV